MKKTLVCGLLALGLWGCGKDATGPSGPPDLTMKDVVGCWKYSEYCLVICFDRAGGYYSMENVTSGNYERLGTFSISGYSVNTSYQSISSWNGVKSLTGHLSFSRRGSDLFDLDASGNSGATYFTLLSIDSVACATPWQYFTKPAGWDSLVKPY